MKRIAVLIKPVSSACNLICQYCFYEDVSKTRVVPSYGKMREEVVHSIIHKCFEAVDTGGSITFAFQGGEPLLAELSFYESFITCVKQETKNVEVNYSLQTNGTLVNEAWVHFFKKHEFLIGISLDGFEENMNRFRYDSKKRGVYEQVVKAVALLQKEEVDFNVLCVVTASLASRAKEVYAFFHKMNITHIQFIPCINDFEENNPEALSPLLYYAFYHTYYKCWEDGILHQHYQSVSLFDNILLLLQDREPFQCGMLGFCTPQFVIESDGSVYPCDFYAQDRYQCGNIVKDRFTTILKNKVLNQFLQEAKKQFIPCKTCDYAHFCHGGCKRMNHVFLSDEMCGYQMLLKELIPSLIRLVTKNT